MCDIYANAVTVVQSNIGLILHAVGEFDVSLRFLQKAVELCGRLAISSTCSFIFLYLPVIRHCTKLYCGDD